MTYNRQPECWSITCDGCGFTVDNLREPVMPKSWSGLKHWTLHALNRDNIICPECRSSVEIAIEEVFKARRS